MAKVELDVAEMVEETFEKHFGVTLDRLREFAEADKDGRCVILPCKVGDTVYIIGLKCLMDKLPMPECSMFECENCWRNTEYEVFERKVTVGLLFKIMFDKESDLFVFGKTVFLTRPEAEAALDAMKGGGE